MIKLLIGGSPCTYWSIAQTNNRETEESGMGWELFKNYLIAKEKWKPDYFLYENNKSASQAIKNQIKKELGVTDQISLFEKDNGVRYTEINSALVSAQSRQRFYVTNFGDIEQPADRGILLKDVLDNAVARDLTCNDKAYTLTATYDGACAWNTIERHQRNMVAEPVCLRYERTDEAKRCRKAYEAHEIKHGYNELNELHPRPDGKTNTLTTVLKDNQIMEPVCVAERGRMYCGQPQHYEARTDGKTNTLASVEKDNRVAEPVKVGYVGNGGQGNRVYSVNGKAVAQTAQSGGMGSNTGLYAEPINVTADGKAQCLRATCYEVKGGKITIKGKQYPIKLKDGNYIIRKLTVRECMRLQTVPEWYVFPVSNSQAYKMLGNGWTVEVIKHLLSHIPNIQSEEIEVLSMYDGMSCGQIALKEMGCNVVKYTSYEIDKYAILTTQYNFPDTIQMGDAFSVRNDNWSV